MQHLLQGTFALGLKFCCVLSIHPIIDGVVGVVGAGVVGVVGIVGIWLPQISSHLALLLQDGCTSKHSKHPPASHLYP